HGACKIRPVDYPLRVVGVQCNKGTPLDGVRFSATALQRSPDESANILYFVSLLFRHLFVFGEGFMRPVRRRDFLNERRPVQGFIPPGGILPAPADGDGYRPVMPKIQNRLFHRAPSSSWVIFTVTIFASPYVRYLFACSANP